MRPSVTDRIIRAVPALCLIFIAVSLWGGNRVLNSVCASPGVPEDEKQGKWLFGSGRDRDGDGGFILINTSDTSGEWTVEEDSLWFRDGADFTEAAAVIDMNELGFRPGDDFTASALVEIEGVDPWNRLGVVALSSDMTDHEYTGTGFYHGQFRVHSGRGYALKVSDGFPGDSRNELSALPMPGQIEDGRYLFTLTGTYDAGGALELRIEVVVKDTGERWISKARPITAPFEGTHFGFGGRFRGAPIIDLIEFSFSQEASDLPEIEEEVISYENTWRGDFGEAKYRVSVRRDSGVYHPLPVAVYLRGLNIPGSGSDSDQAIMNDLLHEGMIVVDLDCQDMPGGFPQRQETLSAFQDVLETKIPQMSQGAVVPETRNLYWIPEGYRLAREIPFWNIEQHGASGSLEYAVNTFNSRVAGSSDREPIDDPDQLSAPGGEPMDYNVYIDVVYPSGDVGLSVPLVAQFSSSRAFTRPASFRGERAIYPLTWLTSGYAVAYVGHIWNPVATYYPQYFTPGPYTLENYNAVAVASAAVRYLRSHKDKYNLSGKIGALGHSKSSYSVVRLADPRHPQQKEWSGHPVHANESPESQPWPDQCSEISVAYASMGVGTRRPEFFSAHMTPFLTACGLYDQYGEWERFPAAVAAAEKEDMQHYAMWMEDMGHDYPVGKDLASGRDRTGIFKTLFDQHLDPGGSPEPLEVLAAIPADGTESVRMGGRSRFIMVDDQDLPEDMHGLSACKPATVVFTRRIDPESVEEESMQVINADSGKTVPGTWVESLQNTRFQFYPDRPLEGKTSYRITVDPGIADEKGTVLQEPVSQEFITK